MSAPTLPTIDDIVEEGLSQAKNNNPSSTKLARAKNEWMEQIKNDISRLARRPRWLQITSHGILTRGRSRYSNPTDFGHDLSLVLLDGSVTGTAQAGSSSSITLQTGSTVSESDMVGHDILVTAGTGVASLSQCTAYDTSTLVATVTPNFNTAPGAGSTYIVVTNEYEVSPGHVRVSDASKIVSRGLPETFSQIGDEDYGEFVFDRPLDKSYGARLRYYADIGRLDLAGAHIQTLYYKWRNLWIAGIKAKELAENDDTEAGAAENAYRGHLNLLRADQYGMDLNNLQAKVVDFYG